MVKKGMFRFAAALLFPLALCLSACSGPSGNRAVREGPELLAAVSILPQTYFLERVAGGRARVLVLVGAGQNPHSYEPTPKQMTGLAEAAFWVLSGTEFEIGLRPKIAALFPALPIIDGTEGVRFRSLEGRDRGGTADEEAEGGPDRHTWLGAEPAKIMAAHIRDALTAADPEGAAVYEQNCGILIGDIDAEFGALRAELASLRGRTVFVYHPAFGYFLDEFGIRQEAVETGGKEPTPRVLQELMGKARREQAAAIFFQAQFPVNAVRTAAGTLGLELTALDPLSPDWLANIRVMGTALKRAVRPGEAE
jgi:zinc transport system substrate-binding protein